MYRTPLTPELRRKIEASIKQQEAELNTCAQTEWVSMHRLALQTTRTIINALPDGYPIPIKDRREG